MMSGYREESDLLGARSIPRDARYGIHTQRAMDNFAVSGRPVHRALIHAYGAVKLAAARANRELGAWSPEIFTAIESACVEMMHGELDDDIRVDALQGGAGTSTNMNVNEVLTNRALERLGQEPGQYDTLSPYDDLNRHQSTNDTYPTALRVAAIQESRLLERALVDLLEAFQAKEKEMADVVHVGRTQLQDAVLTTMGRTMAAFAEAIGRDRWRLYKCEERLRVVPLGGTAIGTGLGAPRPYIFNVVEQLRAITGIGLARSENLVDTIQNADVFVEVSGILSACAANLVKISQDLRLLSSGPDAGLGELTLPARQAGSSIMPGKVNPVIPEAVIQAALVVEANHGTVARAAGMGNLELNAFMPLIADRLLESLSLLRSACLILASKCVRGIRVNPERCRAQVNSATATLTALVNRLGYEEAQALARQVAESGRAVRDVVLDSGKLSAEAFDALTAAEAVMQLGFRMTGNHKED